MILNNEILLEILRDACRAPSGDNTQPWRFVAKENVIRVVNIPEKDKSLFNWRQRTNHVALGAVIENLRVSAENHGFRATANLFPDSKNSLVVAEVVLEPDSSAHNDLSQFITKRATNRRKYYAKRIEPEILSTLSVLAKDIGGRIVFISDRAQVKELARIASMGEKLALENKYIHNFLFGHVTWTKAEDEKKHGFFIDTFEFARPQKVAFRLFRNWNILKLFLPLGISKMIAKDMEKVHATSAAFGAIVTPSDTPEDFLRAGMLLERLWLTATKLGLSLQPTTTVHFIGSRLLDGDSGSLSDTHQQLLRENYASLARMFDIHNPERFGFVFRLGYADPPSAMTTRFEPNVSFED